jgi:hypothetical protein
MAPVPTIDLVNESTVIGDGEIAPLVAALQVQVAADFHPHWNAGCRLVHTRAVGRTSWGLVILDDSDQAGALGYHDLTSAGLPLGKVFAKSVIADGLSWTVTASHELLEMLADPWIDSAVQVGQETFYALEVADACEADQYGYLVNGIEVSDFVLPAWFQPDAAGPFDVRGHITQPLELLPGGYIGEWTPSRGWTQKTARDGVAPPSRRIPLRQKKHAGAPLKRSTRGEVG